MNYKPLDRILLDRFAGLVPPGGLVCDMGCGPGEIADYLCRKKVRVMGIDISSQMIAKAQQLNPAIKFRTGDMFGLDLPDNYFSGMCAFLCGRQFPV